MAMARSNDGPDSSQETMEVSKLFEACVLGRSEDMREYIVQGYDVNKIICHAKMGNSTMLIQATEKGHHECLSVLKEAYDQGKLSQNTVNFRGRDGQTAFYRAMVMGNIVAAELLLSMGADLSIRARSNALPLAAASVEDSEYGKDTAAVKAIVKWAIPRYMALANGEALVQGAITYLVGKSLNGNATLIRVELMKYLKKQQVAEPSAAASASPSLGSKF